MIVKLLDTSNPLILILIFIAGAAFWLGSFVDPIAISSHPDAMPLYQLVYLLLYKSSYISVIIAYFLVFIEAVLINYIIHKNKLFVKSTYLPSLIYILMMSSAGFLQTITPVLIANLFLILTLQKMFDIYDSQEPYEQIFNIGFLTSISSLFYLPSLYYIIVIYICFLVYKIFNIREWIIMFLGILIPYMFVIVYLFWIDKVFIIATIYMHYFRDIKFILYSIDTRMLICLVLTAALTLLSLAKIYNENRERLIKTRLSYLVLLWFLIITIFFIFTGRDNHTLFFEILCIPLSILISNYIQHIKKPLMRDAAFISFIVLVILFRI